ncbi:Ig-like domain-containing protein [Polaromonas sp.]|uniref:Ig-like domain-containing protein n=1 Tax=Polaromonas sp. TaxID=1869339 RepID=UPI003BB56CD9
MKFLKYLSASALAIALVACGGGGGSASTSGSTPPVVTPPAEQPATVEVLTSANTLPSTSGSSVEITAFVKNAANVGVSGQSVTFSASSGTLQGPSVVTDSSGAVTAKLIAGSDKSIRDINVKVTAGAASGSVTVPVSGTRVSIAGSGSLQAGGPASQYVVRAIDSSGIAIGGAKITVSSALGNSLSAASLTTDSTGNATLLYTPNNAGSDSLAISGLGTSANTTVVVNAIDFVVLSPASNTSIPIGALQSIRVKYKLSGVAVPGQTVAFSTTRGTFAVATTTTDANGEALANLSSSTAGPAVVVAQITGVGSVNLPVQFVATTPSSIVVQANPGGIFPNTSGTTVNQSTIEAIVRDANGNAVANRQVNFTTLQDLSNGTLSPGIATTDSNGRAQVQFIPGASSTAANGVIIQAEVASTTIKSTTSLTVNGKALFITMAFGNTIGSVDETTYSKDFSVYVTDANGVAVGNQLISLSVIPTEYRKGTLSNCTSTISSSGAIVSWS